MSKGLRHFVGYVMVLGAGAGAAAGQAASAEAQLGIADAATHEGRGHTTLHFPVTRTGDATSNLVIEYQTADAADHPATAGEDYDQAPAGSIFRLSADEASGTLGISINGEHLPEADENFLLQLTRVLAFSPSPDFGAPDSFGVGGTARSLGIADFDRDGKPDLAVANNSSDAVSVMANASAAGAVSFGSAATLAVGDGPHSLAVSDIDGDGVTDIAVANSLDHTVSILRNAAAVGFGFDGAVNLPVGTTPDGIAVGDLDGDGRPDVATANFGAGSVSVLRNTSSAGSVSFAPAVHFPVGDTPIALAIGDLNGDQRPELVVANNGDDTVSVLRNQSSAGTINLASQITSATRSGPIAVAIGDLDGDQKPDVAVANDGDNSVSVLLNGGSIAGPPLSLASGGFWTVGSRPFAVGIGDLTGDGKPDLAVANNDSDNVTVLLNQSSAGNTAFLASAGFGAGDEPESLGIGDVDGDGKADLAVANFGGNAVSVLRNSPGHSAAFSDNEALGTILDDDTDNTPNRFRFRDQRNAPVGSEVTSRPVRITGMNVAAPISVEGGSYSIGCNGSFVTDPGLVENLQWVCVRHTASGEFRGRADTTLTVGGVSDTFTSTAESKMLHRLRNMRAGRP